jgi:unsaturated rhamnogalacturonyl hydrolase
MPASDQNVVSIIQIAQDESSALLLDGLLAQWRSSGDIRLLDRAREIANGKQGEKTASTDIELYRILQKPEYLEAARTIHENVIASTNKESACNASEQDRFAALYGWTVHDPVSLLSTSKRVEEKLSAKGLTPGDKACLVRVALDMLDWLPKKDASPLQATVSRSLSQLQEWALISHAGHESPQLLAVYSLSKAYRNGMASARSMEIAVATWNRIAPTFASGKNGDLDGAYLLALSEMTQRDWNIDLLSRTRGGKAVFDGWFNRQFRKGANGQDELYHYKPNDDADSGYSTWAHMFQQYGIRTSTLEEAPTASNLADADIYVIASPELEGSRPGKINLMDAASAKAIQDWVSAGGVLVIMQNDDTRADQEHFDTLSDRFGLHFNATLKNTEPPDGDYGPTLVDIPAGAGGIFAHRHKVLMKETCTITVSTPAQIIVAKDGDTMIAASHFGRGVVFAATDPWLYNEYTDGRKLPLGEDNFAAAEELTHWLVAQIPSGSSGGNALSHGPSHEERRSGLSSAK